MTVISGPSEIVDLYEAEYYSRVEQGDDFDSAEKSASMAIRHAGWYQTEKGWEKLGPDLRGKVNVRKATKQPDGRFFIQDVPVFYPNAVKGSDESARFDNSSIKRAIENTNRSIAEGAQKPALVLEHPHPAQKMAGVAKPAFGTAINFRLGPKNDGFVHCDLENVAPEVVDQWKKGNWIGLSAGFVEDAGSLNLRFGHVALLGADMQALSYLPMTELFSSRDLWFSTDTVFLSKGTNMPTPNPEARAAAEKQHYGALSAAYASIAAGEPQSKSKLSEAFSAIREARKQFGNDFMCNYGEEPEAGMEHEDEAEDVKLIEEMLGGGDEDNEDQYAGQEPKEETMIPEATKLDSDLTIEQDDTEIPDAKTNAEFSAMKAELGSLRKQNKELTKTVQAMYGRELRNQFDAFITNLQSEGHQFDAATARETFMECAKNRDIKGIERTKKLLRSTPKKSKEEAAKPEALSEMGTMFSADDGHPGSNRRISNDADNGDLLKFLNGKFPHMKFSADDIAIGTPAVNGSR